MTADTRLSALPIVLTLVLAGLGHLYLKYWRRALVWLSLYLFSVLFLSGYAPMFVGGDYLSPFIVSVLEGRLHPEDVAFPLTILILALLDVYALQLKDESDNGSATPG